MHCSAVDEKLAKNVSGEDEDPNGIILSGHPPRFGVCDIYLVPFQFCSQLISSWGLWKTGQDRFLDATL